MLPDDASPAERNAAAAAFLSSLHQFTAPKSPPIHVDQPGSFPIEAFPPVVRDFLVASAMSARVQVEMVAAPFLALAGAVIGSRLRLDVGGGWVERPVLWIAVIGQTGTGKSPALAAVLAPLDALQQRAWREWQPKHDAWRREIERRREEHRGGPRPRPPRIARLYTTETTIDALVQDLQDAPGIAIVRDELIGIIRGMEQSRGRRGDARQRYLSLWAHAPIAPSRLDPDTPYIRHPVVTIVGGIQPLVYASLRSKDHDGFLERFLPVFVGGRSDYWSESTITATPPPDLDAVTDLLAKLRAVPAAGHGGQVGQVGDPEGILVPRDRAARDVWATWYNDNIDRIDAVPLVVQGFYQKLPAHVARIALILHALWNPDAPDSPLGGDTMIHATRIAECFRGHIHRAILLLGDFDRVPAPRPTLAQRCLRILAETTGPDGWTSRTDIYHRLGRPHPDDLTYALDSLATRGLVRSRRITPPRARKPVEQWRATTPADRYGPSNAT